ncbi:DUF1565 domain-containing protein [bacterium]|nr:DUF1565 domain-containing protein [bacterium]
MRTITFALAMVEGCEANPVKTHVALGKYSSTSNGEVFPLKMKSWVSLVGEAPETTILNAKNAAYHVIYCKDVSHLAIEGLRFIYRSYQP